MQLIHCINLYTEQISVTTWSLPDTVPGTEKIDEPDAASWINSISFHSLACSTLATVACLMFLEHTDVVPASGSLHLLSPPPGMPPLLAVSCLWDLNSNVSFQ